MIPEITDSRTMVKLGMWLFGALKDTLLIQAVIGVDWEANMSKDLREEAQDVPATWQEIHAGLNTHHDSKLEKYGFAFALIYKMQN